MLYKRGKVWWIKIKKNGEVIRKSTGTSNKTLARKVERKVLDEIEEGTWFEKDMAEITLFKDVWDRYLREDCKYKAKGTYDRALQCARNFLPDFGNLTLSHITPSLLSSYKAKRLDEGVKPSTVVKELQFVRRVFSLCKCEWQLIKQSPFEFFKMPKVSDQRIRYFEKGEFEKLIVKCPEWLKPIVTLARYTGIRRGNIATLKWTHVDLENRVINLETTKNGERLTIPLMGKAYDVLAEMRNKKVIHLHCLFVFHIEGQPHSPDMITTAFRRACKRAGIDNFRFHDLRHDFASNLVQKGNDLYVVQNLLGQKDGRMTQRYAHLKLDNLRDAVNSLDEGGTKRGTIK